MQLHGLHGVETIKRQTRLCTAGWS